MLPIAGTLPTTEGTVYTVPGGVKARLTWFSLDNQTASALSVYLRATVSTVQGALTPAMTLQAGAMTDSEPIELWLRQGDSIQGYASASGVKYLFTGEETPI